MYKNSEFPALDWVFSVKVFGYVRYFPKMFGVPRNLDSEIQLKSVLVLLMLTPLIPYVGVQFISQFLKLFSEITRLASVLMNIFRARYIARPRTIISKYLGKYL